MREIALNGRFLAQGLTGVQRYAAEITRALDRLAGEGCAPPVRLLAPPGAAAPWLANIPVVTVGERSGQDWEQVDLPRAARGLSLIHISEPTRH